MMTIQNIFEESHLQADYLYGEGPRHAIIITFTERNNKKLTGPGFGGEFLCANGFDVIAVKTDLDLWYENISAHHLAAIETAISNHPTRYVFRGGYGSSMGAYAAIRFSGALKLDSVFLISPIIDIKSQTDRRWKNDAANMGSRQMLEKSHLSSRTIFAAATDIKSPDRWHLNQFCAMLAERPPKVIAAPYSGHPAGPHLRDIGALKNIVLDFFNDGTTPPNLRKWQKGRKNSATYLYSLAKTCLERKKPKWAAAINSALLRHDGNNPEYHMQTALIQEKFQCLNAAIAACSRAAYLRPQNIHFAKYRDGLIERQLKNPLRP